MNCAGVCERELSLEAMWRAYRASDFSSQNQVEADPSTRGALLNARYYDSSRGQFLSEDPIFLSLSQNLQDPQSLNSYSYSLDNPITKKDPSGKFVDLSGSVTVPNIFDPVLPGPSLSLDLQVDRGGHYSLSVSPGFGWGGYAKPFSAYYVPGPVPNDPVTSTAGADFFLLGFSANNNNGTYTSNPTAYGLGAGADVYLRWPFTLASNLPQPSQSSTLVSNTTISAYNPSQYFQNSTAMQGRVQAAQNYNNSIGGTYGSSPGVYGHSSSGTPLPNPSSRWTTPSGAVVTWSGQLVSAPPSSK
jgi:RHS repeat-associated protein